MYTVVQKSVNVVMGAVQNAGCRDVEASQQHEQTKGRDRKKNILKDGNNGDSERMWLCCRRAESR